jgi:hypothetical protein
LFHPHHLAYGPTGWLAYRIALELGYTGRADLPVQIVNAVAGALGVFFLWRFGTRWTGRSLMALGVALLVGLCYAYWVYAIEVEVYTLAAAFLSLSLWLLLVLDERAQPGWAVALGLAHTGAIMFHQTNLFFGLAVGLFLLIRLHLRRWSILLAYGLSVAIPVTLAYGYVAYASEFPDWQAFYAWFTDYAQSGQWGGFLSLAHFPALRSGLQTAVSPDARLATLVYLIVAVGLIGGLYQARHNEARRAWTLLGGVWLLTYLLFFWWWEPWNIEFWIAVLPLWALWLLSACPPASTESQIASNEAGMDIRSMALAVYTAVPFLLAIQLFRAHFEPIRQMGDASTDYYRQVTEALQSVVQPEELVVTRGNVLDLYVPYYADHPYLLSLRHLEHQKEGDRSQIIDELVGQLDWAVVTGRPFLIDQFVLDEARDPIRNPFGLLDQEIELIKGRYALEPVAWRGEQALFYGTPRFDNRGRTHWNFSNSLQGWSTWGVDSPRFDRTGWCFTGGIDPQLKGPLINLDAQQWTILSIEMTIDVPESTAQIFWRSPEGDYSLDNSLELPLYDGRHVYEVDLAGQPAWQDTIARIRVDPIPGSEADRAAVNACIHEIQFLN